MGLCRTQNCVRVLNTPPPKVLATAEECIFFVFFLNVRGPLGAQDAVFWGVCLRDKAHF